MCDRIESKSDGKTIERFGEIDYATATIRIARYASIEQRWETWLHEVLHGLSEESDARLTEKQVARLAPMLLLMLVDNGFVEIEPLDALEEEARYDSIECREARYERTAVRE